MGATREYYQDKVAVVTGGASGIGLALAEMMLSYGAKHSVIADVDDQNLKGETARLNSAYAGKVLGFHCDVTKEEQVQALIREAAEFGGRIDILFNNAGAGLRVASLCSCRAKPGLSGC
jgi:NAD(P)-dependent dehydrogenase (short-subunit alcohol dehydrogenase family)